MNDYFTLRKANRLRSKVLSAESQKQIREVTRYLRRISWDLCGVELLRSDLIDMAVQANEDGKELFSVTDAKTFVQEVKPSLRRLSGFDFFSIVIPLFCFFGWGIEGLLLNPLFLTFDPNYCFEFSLGYLAMFIISAASAFYVFRWMMEKVGFPPCEHMEKYVLYLFVYVVMLYTISVLLHQKLGHIVFVRIPIWPLTLVNLLLGAILLWMRFYWYGKDERLRGRI